MLAFFCCNNISESKYRTLKYHMNVSCYWFLALLAFYSSFMYFFCSVFFSGFRNFRFCLCVPQPNYLIGRTRCTYVQLLNFHFLDGKSLELAKRNITENVEMFVFDWTHRQWEEEIHRIFNVINDYVS